MLIPVLPLLQCLDRCYTKNMCSSNNFIRQAEKQYCRRKNHVDQRDFGENMIDIIFLWTLWDYASMQLSHVLTRVIEYVFPKSVIRAWDVKYAFEHGLFL